MRGKSFKVVSLAIAVALASVFSIPALAQDVTRSISISREAKLGDQMLTPGKYKVAFDDKKDGEAVVSRGSRELVRASYKLVELGNDAPDNVVIFTAATDGSLQIRRIEIKGWKIALQFE